MFDETLGIASFSDGLQFARGLGGGHKQILFGGGGSPSEVLCIKMGTAMKASKPASKVRKTAMKKKGPTPSAMKSPKGPSSTVGSDVDGLRRAAASPRQCRLIGKQGVLGIQKPQDSKDTQDKTNKDSKDTQDKTSKSNMKKELATAASASLGDMDARSWLGKAAGF